MMKKFKATTAKAYQLAKNINLLWLNAVAAERHFAISRWRILLHWLLLRITLTPISSYDYFAMHLFKAELNFVQRKDYLGLDVWAKIAKKHFFKPGAEDKLFYYDIVRQHGYQSPKIYGLFHPQRRINYATTIKDKYHLSSFLTSQLTYPCFSKPVMYSGSYDSFHLTAYDNINKILFDQDHRPIPLDSFYQSIEKHYLRSGYIFQNVLPADPRFQDISNHRLCTMRILFIMTENGAECLGALLKIPMHNNHADNFWRTGNVIAIIDQHTGRLTQALQKTEFYFPLPIIQHPITKKYFTDFEIPDWHNLKTEISKLAHIFSEFRWQSWDIAFTNDGWLPLELNYPGDIHFAQWLCNKGLNSQVEKLLNMKVHHTIHP